MQQNRWIEPKNTTAPSLPIFPLPPTLHESAYRPSEPAPSYEPVFSLFSFPLFIFFPWLISREACARRPSTALLETYRDGRSSRQACFSSSLPPSFSWTKSAKTPCHFTFFAYTVLPQNNTLAFDELLEGPLGVFRAAEGERKGMYCRHDMAWMRMFVERFIPSWVATRDLVTMHTCVCI
ncbi:hypothetical protein BU24DRAFT_50933 [Aaosphaeria arxii CBS 175.79]|uniref:Uncharacterized protein n=1 Tax=Aaosphaeria arxii CBS 175.79 TaxID=1450172 RepID=A0A6A5XDD1_9PLEO|nr:uncharacterized protein BU24DRAFT_50933 [Aaosphaeria arxii CBS 175.79]KAF2011008.1 hypothetical protein BU24DRAFT_50933 [Aaosphaeria arxii CBS 175.79]